MTDERPTDDASRQQSTVPPATATSATPAATAPSPTPPKRRKRRWGVILFGIFVILPLLLFILWTTIALNWTYSRGDRAGYIQKFSHKGWICKTWEGEIAMTALPGATPQYFQFTVRNDSIANVLEQNAGKQVSLTYEEHRGVPSSCFGDTRYFVTSVRRLNP